MNSLINRSTVWGMLCSFFAKDALTKDILAKEEQCLEISKPIIDTECSHLQHITYNYHYHYHYYRYFHYYCFAFVALLLQL